MRLRADIPNVSPITSAIPLFTSFPKRPNACLAGPDRQTWDIRHTLKMVAIIGKTMSNNQMWWYFISTNDEYLYHPVSARKPCAWCRVLYNLSAIPDDCQMIFQILGCPGTPKRLLEVCSIVLSSSFWKSSHISNWSHFQKSWNFELGHHLRPVTCWSWCLFL